MKGEARLKAERYISAGKGNGLAIVAYGDDGYGYMLQSGGKLNWFFDNSHLIVFRTLETALKRLERIKSRYRCSRIVIYGILKSDYPINICKFSDFTKNSDRIIYEWKEEDEPRK